MFELLPVVDKMLELYQIPIGQKRFDAYLKLLEGETKGNLSFPIGAFNPMAKEHVLIQLNSLKKIGAEEAMQNELKKLNSTLSKNSSHPQFKVAINLADDLKGGWTNKFTTDYDLRFKLNPYLKRGFCVSIIWTSEQHTIDLIVKRTLQSVYRTIYRLSQSQPKTLIEHITQEDFVLKSMNQQVEHNKNFLELHKNSENYHVIFNYFYGDQASEMMAFPVYGSTGLNLN